MPRRRDRRCRSAAADQVETKFFHQALSQVYQAGLSDTLNNARRAIIYRKSLLALVAFNLFKGMILALLKGQWGRFRVQKGTRCFDF
jgi:hypothetical protein